MTEIVDGKSYLRKMRNNPNYRNLPCIGTISGNACSNKQCFESCSKVEDCIIYKADAACWDHYKGVDPKTIDFHEFLDRREEITEPLASAYKAFKAEKYANAKVFILPTWLARQKNVETHLAATIIRESEKAYYIDPIDEYVKPIWVPKSKVTVQEVSEQSDIMLGLLGFPEAA